MSTSSSPIMCKVTVVVRAATGDRDSVSPVAVACRGANRHYEYNVTFVIYEQSVSVVVPGAARRAVATELCDGIRAHQPLHGAAPRRVRHPAAKRAPPVRRQKLNNYNITQICLRATKMAIIHFENIRSRMPVSNCSWTRAVYGVKSCQQVLNTGILAFKVMSTCS
ncbi:unnamed protein product [Euphydryas editha]|uniref:Uncharacterized protein n=1 Tax=Euphydryas editha TaxID=104508 RepID=A0AAU9TWE5_EUPED|nr:unnamed protein product [Euphydryas editha]